MSETKYKVGDVVKVRDDLETGKKYYMKSGFEHDSVVDSMLTFRGKSVTIESITSTGKYSIVGDCYNWTDEMFEDDDVSWKVVIIGKGHTTEATYYEDNKVVKKVTTKKHSDDEHSSKVACDVLINRLFEKPRYNGKVVCTDNCYANNRIYTVGKIYKFNDGHITADDGIKYPLNPVYSFEEWINWTGSKFIEVVE